jgi:HK97 family phage portal protein
MEARRDMNLGWPFARTRQESKAAAPLVALSQLGAAAWGGRDAAALTQDGYLRNAVAYRCVRMVAEAAASVPLVTQHDGAAKLLRQPAPDMAGAGFLEGIYTQVQLAGNAFVEAVQIDGRDGIAALFALRPDSVRPVTDARGWVEAWAVRERRGERMIRREESGWSPLLHLKLFNPVDDVMGLPPLGAARRALDLHNASADWAKALIDNSAKPSGALVYGAGGRLPDDQYETLKAELEAHYAGAANAGRPLLLEGGLEWRPMSLSPAEMDFQEARHAAAREIALALGVPPMLLGIPGDNTYSNYREANLAFWRMTVLPLAEKTAAALSLWLDAPFGGDVDVRCDMDRVPALSVERDALWARLETASFATLDEKRAIAGLGT